MNDWKAGALQMNSAAAGSLVAKTAPKEKPAASKRAKSTVVKEKPFVERTKEEKFGSKPKQVPEGKQMKDVLAYLEAHQDRDAAISWDEIVRDAIPSWYDTKEGGILYNLLINNPRVLATVHGFQYRSEHGIHDKASLLRYLKAHPDGVKATTIKDGYENVLLDADQLQAEGRAYKLYNTEFKEDVYFPAPDYLARATPDFVELYLKTQLPQDPQVLFTSLKNLNLASAFERAISSRKPANIMKEPRPKKKARKMNIRHLTNTHMADLLTGADAEAFSSIDRR